LEGKAISLLGSALRAGGGLTDGSRVKISPFKPLYFCSLASFLPQKFR